MEIQAATLWQNLQMEEVVEIAGRSCWWRFRLQLSARICRWRGGVQIADRGWRLRFVLHLCRWRKWWQAEGLVPVVFQNLQVEAVVQIAG